MAASLALLLSGCGPGDDPPELRNLVAADEVPALVEAETVFWFGDPVDLTDARRGPVSPPVEARAIVDDPTVVPGSVLLLRLLDGTTSLNQSDSTSTLESFSWQPWLGEYVEIDEVEATRTHEVADGEVGPQSCAHWDLVQAWRVVDRDGDEVDAELSEVLVVRSECEAGSSTD